MPDEITAHGRGGREATRDRRHSVRPDAAVIRHGFDAEGLPVLQVDPDRREVRGARAGECSTGAVAVVPETRGGPLMGHRTLEDLMTPADLVVSIRPDTPYKLIARLLAAYAISGIPVLGPTGRVIGVVTESDLLAKEIRANGSLPERTAAHRAPNLEPDKARALIAIDLMSTPAITAAPHELAATAATRMERHGIRRLPVVDEAGHLLGIVSRRDLLRPYLRRDEEIRAEALALTADEFGYVPEGWNVRVEDGVVTLAGVLPGRGDLHALRAAIGRIDGVVSVEGEPNSLVEEV